MINFKEIAWKKQFSLNGNTLYYLDRLQQWQWLSSDKILQLQQEKLRGLLLHAFKHVPYYRSILREVDVVSANGTVQLNNFSQIPLLGREALQTNYEALKSDDIAIRNWYENWSGGSTGEPVRLLQERNYFDWNQAVKILFYQWCGRELVDKQVVLWASERDLMVGRETWKTRMGRWIRNERWFNTRLMSEKSMRTYLEELQQFRPSQILGYVESIYELARFAQRSSLPVYSPKSIMTTASVLHPHMRQTIEEVFQSPVFNRYGSREIGAIASECDHHGGLHVSALTHYVEIISPTGLPVQPGERGELVITTLNNYAMPMIRYRIGDMAQWSDRMCTCGRTWPLLKEISGRVNDSFVKQNGDLVDGRLFVILLATNPFVKKYQVVQNEVDQIHISIIPHQPGMNPHATYQEQVTTIIDKTKFLMGDSVDVHIHFVEEIPTTASGKFRFTICNVKRS
ncbi:phenylacetate--CoA ligase family protein [Brevibacillus sp. 179-C9.3 HS]|uniref:phenylacetate--CoA ligase family protein n=1 Tax=unclassified Brevibacillus TaxID=2684853 RepID=UPI0039A199A2